MKWIKKCETFLRLAVVRLDLNYVCRHAVFYDREGVKWVRNDYELKLKVARSKKVKLSRYLEP